MEPPRQYGDDLVIKFEEDDEFRIAVSVDMLDTGVDVPAVLNLVFFKKVRSRIKFVQMIGRGTRLCENIYGDGKNKNGFLIFDYCGNFEYFGLHPDGKDGKETLTLSQRLFQVKLDMLYELQRLEYQEDDWFRAYYARIKEELQNAVIQIKSHSNRIQVREAMQYVDKYSDKATWAVFSPVMVKEAKVHLSPLLDSGLGGDHLAIAFDIRMYYIEKALLRTGTVNGAAEHIKTVRMIAQYLLSEKASVPQVLAKAADLKELADDAFWDAPCVPELEKKRETLRDLMQFLKGSGRKKFDIDIEDTVDDADYQPDDTMIDIRTYREKVIDYLAENSDSPVIRKIHNLEPITNDDLRELEHILWHELGTQQEYAETTSIGNLAVFVRSLIGLSQEAVNEKFGEYLSGNLLNSQQQEFVRTIISYVRENGDVELSDLVNTEPFNNYDLNEIFGIQLPIPAIAAAMETIRQNIIVFNYGLLFVRDRRKATKEYVEQATSKYDDYKNIRSQIRAKAKERGKLEKEFAGLSVFAAGRRKELNAKIAELSEEIADLQFEEKSIMRGFDKTDATKMKGIEREISKSEARIVKLDTQEVEFTSAVNCEKEKFAGMKAQTAYLDQNELNIARLALRLQIENEGRERIRKGAPDGRVSFAKYQDSVRDADRVLEKDDIAQRRAEKHQRPKREAKVYQQER